VAVVERDVGRRAQNDEHTPGIDRERLEHTPVRLEVRQEVLLLQAAVLQELRRPGAVAREPLRRDGFGDDDLRRRAAAELMLEPRELVVEGRGARDAEPTRRHRQLVGAMREREVEVAAAGPAAQRAKSPPHRPQLRQP
jgi:hypothetical protein